MVRPAPSLTRHPQITHTEHTMPTMPTEVAVMEVETPSQASAMEAADSENTKGETGSSSMPIHVKLAHVLAIVVSGVIAVAVLCRCSFFRYCPPPRRLSHHRRLASPLTREAFRSVKLATDICRAML